MISRKGDTQVTYCSPPVYVHVSLQYITHMERISAFFLFFPDVSFMFMENSVPYFQFIATKKSVNDTPQMLLLNVVPWIMVSLHEDSTFSGTNVFHVFTKWTWRPSQEPQTTVEKSSVKHQYLFPQHVVDRDLHPTDHTDGEFNYFSK